MKCRDCGTKKNLTRHSEIGNHQPPFIPLCESCHDKRHGFGKRRTLRTQKGNIKYAKGTNRKKRKKEAL